MYAKRMAYVVFYQGKRVLDKLRKMPVDIAYVSKKQHYAIVYGDAEQEANLKKQLKDVKGFKYFGPSHLFDEGLNF
ncbi:MAG: DUF2129 domain-containing protein [Acholeplasmataceae bacterium]|nr:MAG: DUF2129 domain-containing protein [Acholeplasmataceae bacterium]